MNHFMQSNTSQIKLLSFNHYVIAFFIIHLFLSGLLSATNTPAEIQYLHPQPESDFNSNETTILLRFAHTDLADAADITFYVNDDKGGEYAGSTFLAGDNRTFVFQPDQAFQPGETVWVTIRSAFLKNSYYSYSFRVSKMASDDKEQARRRFALRDELQKTNNTESVGRVTTINGVTVPSDFPRLHIMTNSDESAPGYLFFGLRQSYLMILKNDGTPYYYEKSNDFLMDFKVQPNGLLSRLVDNWDSGERFYTTIDHNFVYQDTFAVKLGYETDHHDFQLLPNGHALMIAGDYQIIDMSELVAGGKKNATVRGSLIQELDQNKDVVFQWNCWDHLPITDAVHEKLTANSIDYVHMNSVALDYDGNIVASCRNLSQCLKINRETGEVMWILGGASSSFEFVNDTDQNSYQHMFRPVPDKPNHYTLFDNGNYHVPQYNRAVEFKVDTTTWTATKVWEHRPTPDYHAKWLGSVQRLPNGHTLINFANGGAPFAYEVTAEDNVVYKARAREALACYRTFRFDWQGVAVKPSLFVEMEDEHVVLIFNKFGDEYVDFYNIYYGQSPESMALLDTTLSTRYDVHELESYKRYFFKVTATSNGVESDPSEIKYIDVKYFQPDQNMVLNGDFSNSDEHWDYIEQKNVKAHGSIQDGEYRIFIADGGVEYKNIQLKQDELAIYQGKTYRFEFDAYADAPRAIDAKVTGEDFTSTNYARIGFTGLAKNKKHYAYTFEMLDETDLNAQVIFNCGGDNATVYIDNVSLMAVSETALKQKNEKITRGFELFPNYPNPFNATTQIAYSLPNDAHVSLDIRNVLGEHVLTLINKKQKQGPYTINWFGRDSRGKILSSGLYFCTLKTGDYSKTIKLVLSR